MSEFLAKFNLASLRETARLNVVIESYRSMTAALRAEVVAALARTEAAEETATGLHELLDDRTVKLLEATLRAEAAEAATADIRANWDRFVASDMAGDPYREEPGEIEAIKARLTAIESRLTELAR